MPWPVIVTVPFVFLVHVGVAGVAGQASVTDDATNVAPAAALSLLVTTFIDWATPCGPEVVSATAVGFAITVGV